MDGGDGQLVNVFWREDGSTLFSETWGANPLPSSMVARPNPLNTRGAGVLAGALTVAGKLETGSESASAVWSLVQVFIQFSREVDGGNVQRLVFREPLQPVGKRRVFGAAPHGHATTQQRPVVIHIAHDALFVVTVVELLPPEALQLQRVKREIPGEYFAHELLLHFASEQALFLRQQVLSSEGAAASQRRSGSSLSRGELSGALVGAGSNWQTSPHAGTSLASREEIQASYASESSEPNSYESFESSGASFSSSSHEDELPKKSTPLMPVDRALVSEEVRRIFSTYKKG